ncbi:carbamoyltransferase family protein [Synoicihabitans lomoniglobus]|uniref:Carbamoyltransferase n=1 Tax=Synoicihabitans lomoniglobus TaxID=2909285 RepID=A0AAF0CR70_9BACT|nr:carbamoyltransferase [Opitutaceae bacterium LMO-M01]WED66551.1 carbamoyltransferase [Opitutaceae bacterium LMO-M01]
MSTYILGLSAFYHDSAAALVVDGIIVAAAQEERFTRRKHDKGFPQHAIDYCLREAGITAAELDHVVFYEKPFLRFERLLETYLGVAPTGFGAFLKAMPQWIHQKLQLPREMNRGLGGLYRKPYVFTEHHESHAASAFFPSPFEEAAILTLDGVGEWATASMGRGRGHRIELTHELHFPHSLGLLYSAFTYFCGFRVNSGEYKLMGLAPYGEPRYVDTILQHLMDLKEDGSFRLDQSYFNYCQGLTMTSEKFARLFEGPPRSPESELTPRELDLAASVQVVTEMIMLRMAHHLHALTGSANLCLAGGVALNCVGNGRLLRESPFERIWIQPAAGDAGGALGAALFVWHQLLDKPRPLTQPDAQSGSLLGPAPDPADIESTLRQRSAVYTRARDEADLCDRVATLLAEGNVVGWVQGRMEFGPRALGSRSILGDPRDRKMQSKMNLKIKFRESFRPFAPIVKAECASDYFDLLPGQESPYMLIVAPVQEDQRIEDDQPAEGLARVNDVRSTLPAVTHVDYSARIQTIDTARSPRLHRLLSAFEAQTECPVLINTSFNIRGEPIVCTAADAYRCFLATGMDALVIDDFILLKDDQPEESVDAHTAYLARFGKD